jgi:hypothetical protein
MMRRLQGDRWARAAGRAMRFVAACLAALQLVLPGAISVADARVEAQALTSASQAHVEEQSSTACPRVHELDCALCQYLSSARGEPPAGEPLLDVRRHSLCVSATVVGHAATVAGSHPPTPAPPRPS